MARRSSRREPDDSESKGERSKEHIKRVIAELTAERDVADITLADICAAAELTTGAVYFHFQNKDDAVEAMAIDELGRTYNESVQRARSAAGFRDMLATVIDHTTRSHTARKGLVKAIFTVINTRPRAYAAWIAARAPLLEILETSIAAMRSEHLLSPRPAKYLAHMILNSVEDLNMDAFQWANPTLAPYARDTAAWNRRQFELWSWAVLAPMPIEAEGVAESSPRKAARRRGRRRS